MPNPPSALMIAIDQLPAWLLGPYGNTLIETEYFNALAAESLVFDFAFADSVNLNDACKRLWFPAGFEVNNPPNLLALPDDCQIETILITDDPRVANHPSAHFDRVLLVEQPEIAAAAAEVAQTQLVSFFAEVAAWLETEWEPGQLCWIHSQGLAGAWDAPYSLRLQFVGDDDPNPPRFIDLAEVSAERVSVDPDQQLGLQQAAAAQISVLDQCLGILWHAWQPKLDQLNPLIALTSPRGCGLGEHEQLGAGNGLYSEMTSVPLFVRFPASSSLGLSGERPSGRSGRMISVADASRLLAAWLQPETEAFDPILAELDTVFPADHQDLVILSSDQHQMIQTPVWKLIRDLEGNVELFAKPDDRWEINDVSDRCPQIVEQLLVWLDRLQPNSTDDNPDVTIHRNVTVVSELMERWD